MIESMLDRIFWLGHDSFRVEGSKTVYFDPYEISGGPEADLILISHAHFDHCSPDDVASVQGEGTVIVTEPESSGKLTGDVRVLGPGDSLTLDGVTVSAVPAYNTDKAFHPRDNQWLGFIVEMDGVRIYHAGDTDFIPEMEGLGVDIALLPVSGTYVMTWEQAVEAAKAIRPQWAIPMHYGTVVGNVEDARRFEEALQGTVQVRVLEKSA